MTQEKHHQVSATSGGGEIPVWTTTAGAGLRPGLLLIPAIFGVDEGTKTLARDLAAAGAHVWVVDPFWRTAPGVIVRDKEGFSQGIARAREVDEALAVADYADLIRNMGELKDCNGRVAVLGICFAGKFSMLLASTGHAAAGASFHGPGMAALAELAPQINVPMALHFGDKDMAIPVADVAVLQDAFENHDEVEILLHEGGIEHGFGDPGSDGFNSTVYRIALASVHALLDRLR